MRNNPKLLFFVILLYVTNLKAQTLYPGDLILTTQLAIDSFPNNFTEIEGNVLISGTNVTNLSPLSNLTTVGGSIEISSTSFLYTLNGLQNLSGDVSGDLVIRSNSNLSQIDVLSQLGNVAGQLRIANNRRLVQIDGLSNMESVGANVEISQNGNLKEVDGLSGLQNIGGDLFVKNNEKLVNLDGFDNVVSVGGGIEISSNKGLERLSGFNGLTYVGGNGTLKGIIIDENRLITNISGFNALNSLEGYIVLVNNDALITIGGFQNLEKIGNRLAIIFNRQLKHINGFDALTNTGGDLTLEYNPELLKIDGFTNLTAIHGEFELSNNSLLLDINALSQLQSIDGNVRIEYNDKLRNLDGLSGLNTIGASINIWFNEGIENLDGLNNLTTIAGDLMLWDNDVLTSIKGLGNLTSVGGDLRIYSNPIIESIDGLEGITTVPDLFQIYNNKLLVDISGVENIKSVMGNFSVTNNPLLKECCAFDMILNTPGSIAGTTNFSNNQVNCNSVTNIDQSCDTDGDGVSPMEGDCDDNNVDIFPGNLEICDGIDNNCNELIDSEDPNIDSLTTMICYIDQDADGFGDSQTPGIYTCEIPEGYVTNNSDCDDQDASINPASEEICDGIDNNCDGVIDELGDINTAYEWIKRVKLGSINNYSGNDQGYGDYLHLSTEVAPEYWYKIKLKPGFTYWFYREYWRVWIDWNQDGDFDDPGELEVQKSSYWNISKWFKVPADAVPGKTKMRIAMAYGAYPDACANFAEGEVEDYTIQVIGTLGTNSIDPETPPLTELADTREEEDDLGDEQLSRVKKSKDLFMVYPNPTVDYVFVKLNPGERNENLADITITAATGQLIKKYTSIEMTERPHRLELGDLSNGMYLITIYQNGTTPKTKQIMIHK